MVAKLKQGDAVTLPDGREAVVYRVVSNNPDSTCLNCGSSNVRIGDRTYAYWVTPELTSKEASEIEAMEAKDRPTDEDRTIKIQESDLVPEPEDENVG